MYFNFDQRSRVPLKNVKPDRFTRLDVYWKQKTSKDRQKSQIYLLYIHVHRSIFNHLDNEL